MNTYTFAGLQAAQNEHFHNKDGEGARKMPCSAKNGSKRGNIGDVTFSGDELLLALVSLVRATRPGMLRQDGDGFSVDFEAIAAAKKPLESDSLLLKLGAAMQAPPPEASADANSGGANSGGDTVSLDLSAREARQIAAALAELERLQAWPADVVALSRELRARLESASAEPPLGRDRRDQ